MRVHSERGYPLFFFSMTRAWRMSVLFGLLVIALGSVLYIWYSKVGNDPTPDSIPGLGYALAGTTFLTLAAVMYSLQRRSRTRKRAIGQLHAVLSWHICFGVVGLALLFLHSFGNFNPRSGTFALCGMIALVISGFVGRLLDRVMPRLIAGEVRKALTTQGEDRIEAISQKLQAIVQQNAEEPHDVSVQGSPPPNRVMDGTSTEKPSSTGQRTSTAVVRLPSPFRSAGHSFHTSWDLAYISLEETPQEMSLNAQRHPFVPHKKSALARPEARIPGAQGHISALKNAQRALQRELFYRYVIRYWRVFHIGLALLTIGLTLWHLEYALQLLIPMWLHR